MSRFRPAEPADVDAIVAMMRGYYAQDGYTFVESEARAAALMLIADPAIGRLWVACEGKTVVGYVAIALGFSLEYRGREAFVDELQIAERHRGRGLGREALELYRGRGFQDYDRYLMTKWLSASKRAPRP